MAQLLRRCFKTYIVCPFLLIANTTLLAFKTLFLFFQNLRFQIGSAAYLWMRLIHGRLRYKHRSIFPIIALKRI